MKTKLFIAAWMLIAAITTGQNKEVLTIEVTPPKFNSPESVEEFIKANVVYPADAYKRGVEGTEVVQFTVTSDGEVKDFELINSVSKEIDNEIIRLLKFTDKKWIPGTNNGKPVSMEKEISIAFVINPSSDFTEKAKLYMAIGNELCFTKNKPEKAIRFFNLAVNYLPGNENVISIRGYCKYLMGKINEAEKDWERAEILAQRNGIGTNTDNLAINGEYLTRTKQLMKNVEK